MVPMNSVTVPSAAMVSPHCLVSDVLAVTGSNHTNVRIKPYTPVLIITPESSAETGEGAAGCASGSHIWPNGHMPALMPKPTRKSSSARLIPPPVASTCETCAAIWSKS